MFGGLHKFSKPNPAEKATFKSLPILSGSIFLYGRIGAAKSVTMKSLAEHYHDDERLGYKIFDIWGGDRNEHLYWCFPSREVKYWNNTKKLLGLDKPGPHQYQVHLIYPYWEDTTPKKLPFDAPNIKSSIIQIPINSITADDLMLATGLLGEPDKYLWREATDQMHKKDGPRKFLEISKEIATKNQNLFRNFIAPCCKNKLFTSDVSSTALDIIDEMKDKETISVLCLDFIPKDYKLFIMGWLLHQINNKLDAGKLRPKNILLMREAAEFFSATDDSVKPETYKIFRSQMSHFLRMGRRGICFFLDAQSPAETKGLVDGQQDITILCKLPAESDRLVATDRLRKDGLITTKQVKQLAILEPGQMMFIESGKKAKMRYTFMCRSDFWKPGYGNFYDDSWKKLNNNWKNFETQIDEIDSQWKLEDTQIEELNKLAELKKKADKEAKERQKEQEDEDEEIRKLEKEAKRRHLKEVIKGQKARTNVEYSGAPAAAAGLDIGRNFADQAGLLSLPPAPSPVEEFLDEPVAQIEQKPIEEPSQKVPEVKTKKKGHITQVKSILTGKLKDVWVNDE